MKAEQGMVHHMVHRTVSPMSTQGMVQEATSGKDEELYSASTIPAQCPQCQQQKLLSGPPHPPHQQ